MFLVDIGNSRIKWASADELELSAHGSSSYSKSGLNGVLARIWQGMSPPQQVWISCVSSGGIADQTKLWISENWKCGIQFASVSPAACGVINAYPDYARLGIDRWLALIAAWHKFSSAACIVDCGTAVTIDGLNNRGEHTGGLILPGISIMQQSLFDATAMTRTGIVKEFSTLANNTEQAVAAGCRLAIAGLVERVSKDLQELNDNVNILLTGGDAETIGKLLKLNYNYEPFLVLEGLALYAREYS
jgi:type III pantothenate kinase